MTARSVASKAAALKAVLPVAITGHSGQAFSSEDRYARVQLRCMSNETSAALGRSSHFAISFHSIEPFRPMRVSNALTRATRASPSVKPNESLDPRSGSVFLWASDTNRASIRRWEQQGADWPNYKRSFMWRCMPRTLMKDARERPIR